MRSEQPGHIYKTKHLSFIYLLSLAFLACTLLLLDITCPETLESTKICSRFLQFLDMGGDGVLV